MDHNSSSCIDSIEKSTEIYWQILTRIFLCNLPLLTHNRFHYRSLLSHPVLIPVEISWVFLPSPESSENITIGAVENLF
jgi:hypothetical protein